MIKGIGKTKPRTPTSEAEGVGGAARPQSKRPGASHRNVTIVRKAYETKIKLDRRLRRMAQEIQAHLAGADAPDGMINVCSRCGRIGEDAWAYRPACGYPMVVESA